MHTDCQRTVNRGHLHLRWTVYGKRTQHHTCKAAEIHLVLVSVQAKFHFDIQKNAPVHRMSTPVSEYGLLSQSVLMMRQFDSRPGRRHR